MKSSTTGVLFLAETGFFCCMPTLQDNGRYPVQMASATLSPEAKLTKREADDSPRLVVD